MGLVLFGFLFDLLVGVGEVSAVGCVLGLVTWLVVSVCGLLCLFVLFLVGFVGFGFGVLIWFWGFGCWLGVGRLF